MLPGPLVETPPVPETELGEVVDTPESPVPVTLDPEPVTELAGLLPVPLFVSPS
jgi:hypothetical protein